MIDLIAGPLALEDAISDLLNLSITRFEEDNHDLRPIGSAKDVLTGAVSVQRFYDGAHTLTAAVEYDMLTEGAAKARVRFTFYDETLKKSRSRNFVGYFHESADGWLFSRHQNKQIKDAQLAVQAFEFLAQGW